MSRLRKLVALVASSLALSAATTNAALAAPAAAHRSATVTVFKPPPGTDGPFGVTAGPGGTWFSHGATIDRLRRGRITEFAVPDPAMADTGWLTWDGGARIWFADRGTGRLGTIDGRGRVREFQIPNGVNGPAVPQGIVVGPGAHVWFTDQANARIGRLDTATGMTSMFPIPTAGGGPLGLVRGPDGALWFTERSADKVGRMVAGGSFTEWTLDPGAFPNRIVVGADGAIWFTELRTSELGRIDRAGRLTQIPLAGGPVGLTLGSDGHLYTALFTAGVLARLDRHGNVSAEWALPGATGALQVAQSHGNLWVTDPFSDLLFQLVQRRVSP